MLSRKHSKFSLPKNITYLNCAYMSPLLKSVEKAGLRGVRLKRNPTNIQPDDFFIVSKHLKQEFSKLINLQNPDKIAVIPSVSYGIANVARNVEIGKGEHILVAADQFPSNYYPWQALCEETGAELKIVAPGKEFENRGQLWNLRFLEAINHNTRIVAVAHTHWADGTVFDLEALRKRTRDVGALLIVDGTQSVGAYPFDVAKINPDALICAGYKWLLGPYSIGLAYYGDHFADGKPIEHNWINRLDAENFSALVNYQPKYQTGASRFSVGEHSNFVLLPMLLKAVQQINRWGVENIQEYCKFISEDAIVRLREKDFIIEALPHRGSHLFGIRHARDIDPEKLRKSLNKYKVHVSLRGSAIRVAPHVYNNAADLQKLVSALKAAIA